MRKLTYVIAMMALLLTGCSQDESVMENKGELVTLNYNVSLGDGVQSRTGGEPQNQSTQTTLTKQLLCAIYEISTAADGKKTYTHKKTDIVSSSSVNAQGAVQFSYSPSLLNTVDYKIVFFACNYDATEGACFDFGNENDLQVIKINDTKAAKACFASNESKDAFVGSDEITNGISTKSGSIGLTRPFSQVNVLTSVGDYNKAVGLGRTPSTTTLTFSKLIDTYNALDNEWSNEVTDKSLKSDVDANKTLTISKGEGENKVDVDYCYLANTYLFASGSNPSCVVTVMDGNNNVIYTSSIPQVPLGSNQRTNMYNENLLTGGGISYTITINDQFIDDNNQPIN